MVGGFPIHKRRPKPVQVPTVAVEDIQFDEDGRRRISEPLSPAPTRPLPYARPLPPMPTAPKAYALPLVPDFLGPGGLPLVPRRPTAPTVKREGTLPPPKAAAPAPAAVKRPSSPPTPYVRKQQPQQYLDPETIPYDPPANWGKR